VALATPPPPANEGLSEREQAVLEGLARGQSCQGIAAALSVSTGTVNRHVKHICEKLRACNREEAVRKGCQRGWL
jgi:DNA-binding NarL/FixJ family response regulator